MKKLVSVLLVILTTCIASADELDTAAFMQLVRRSGGAESWGRMSGTVRHRRQRGEIENAEIYFGITIRRDRMIAQIIFGGQEGYFIGQNFGDRGISTVSPMLDGGYQNGGLMARFGVEPADLTMSFLYFPVKGELKKENFRMLKCRVVELEDAVNKQSVRVWISESYFFPLKAEFRRAEEENPYRTLEIESFKSQNDLYYAEKLNVSGPGWRTQIDFSQAQLGLLTDEAVNIYQKIE